MSVRGERVIYRERDEDWQPERRSYTTVKRYQVPERNFDEDVVQQDKIIIKRERREDPAPPPAPRTEIDYRVTERDSRDYGRRDEGDWRVTERVTEREREPQRRDISYRVLERESDHDRHSGSRSDFRFVERERETVRAPSPPTQERVREFRFERERERSYSPPRREERPAEVERYVRNTEYYQQPQPIIIQERAAPQPIIIREERREPQQIVIRRDEPQYEIIEREEVRDDRQSLVRREEPPAPATVVASKTSKALSVVQKPQDEDYFYERRIREVDRGPRRDHYREDDIRPRDSASQYGSDDSYEYVRRERVVEEGSRSRERSPHHRRHLAEGAIAGIAGAEILRSHRKKEGRDPGGRGRSLVGGAAIGALGAEALTRAKSFRRGSRSRSRSSSYESRRRRRHRSRSRSKSRVRQLGGLAAVAAVGAIAGYVIKNRGKNNETIIVKEDGVAPRRSRSRRRRASVDTYGDTIRSESQSARDPEHRNRRIAQAGLASAAAAGIWERVRSKSRGGKGRSKSRVRTGVPIAAAGLGGAALAGLYEKNKASKEAKKEAIIQEEIGRGRGRHSRSRSRSRSVPAPYPVDDRRRVDRDYVAYGADPIYPDAHRGYYSDEEPGSYRRRHERGSSGSSPDTRTRRSSRSRSRSRRRLAEGAIAAGAAGVAAHEIGKRRERSRSRQRRRHDDDYSESTDYDRPVGAITPPPQEAYNHHQNAGYPGSNYFPPPPNAAVNDPVYNNANADPYAAQRDAQNYNPYPAYNPADYPAGTAHHQPYEQSRGTYGESDATLGAPYPGQDTFAGDSRYAAAPEDVAAQREREHEMRENAREANRGRDPGNVSGSSSVPAPTSGGEDQDADGLKTPRARSTSRVRFDLGSNVEFSPEARRRREGSNDRSSRERDRNRRGDSETDDDTQSRGGSGKEKDRSHHRRRHHRRSGEDGARSDSDETVDLPARFDDNGNKKPESSGNELADKIQDLLSGKGGAGKLLEGLLGGGLGQERDEGDGGRSGRRRRRRD